MKIITSSIIRATVQDLYKISDQSHWEEKLKDLYGLKLEMAPEVHDRQWITRQICDILKPIPPELIKACKVTKIIVTWLGESKPLFPNHGFYRPSDQTVTLNSDIFYHPDMPDDFFDQKGSFVSRPEQTLLHEMSHSFIDAQGGISMKPEWMRLSGWSETYKPGLMRVDIKDKGMPEIIGDMWFDPKIGEFCRFYGKRNSEEDLADTMSFFLAGMKDKVPPAKRAYLEKLLRKYL